VWDIAESLRDCFPAAYREARAETGLQFSDSGLDGSEVGTLQRELHTAGIVERQLRMWRCRRGWRCQFKLRWPLLPGGHGIPTAKPRLVRRSIVHGKPDQGSEAVSHGSAAGTAAGFDIAFAAAIIHIGVRKSGDDPLDNIAHPLPRKRP
jgi:hypothetical protein